MYQTSGKGDGIITKQYPRERVDQTLVMLLSILYLDCLVIKLTGKQIKRVSIYKLGQRTILSLVFWELGLEL